MDLDSKIFSLLTVLLFTFVASTEGKYSYRHYFIPSIHIKVVLIHYVKSNILPILLIGQLKLGADCKDASPAWKCRFFVKHGKCDTKGDECQLSCGICTTETGNGINIFSTEYLFHIQNFP